MRLINHLIILVVVFYTHKSHSFGSRKSKSGASPSSSVPTSTSAPILSAPDSTPLEEDSSPISNDPEENSSATPTPSREQVIKGWLQDYSDHIIEKIQKDYPSMMSVPAWKMDRMCPNWEDLNNNERSEFWSHLYYSMAIPESSQNRTLVYREKSMKTDSVTGYQVRSEGLLQLSYQDVKSYSYKGGDIIWAQDRESAIRDYESETQYGDPDRTILNAYANLNLGIFITYKLIYKVSTTLPLEDAMGKYWYVMKTSSTNEFNKVYNELKKRFGVCFN